MYWKFLSLPVAPLRLFYTSPSLFEMRQHRIRRTPEGTKKVKLMSKAVSCGN